MILSNKTSIIIICGWPLSGKSQLATKIHDLTGIHFADIDEISRVCIGMPNSRNEIKNRMEMAYELLHQTVRVHLEVASAPQSLIIVATYSKSSSWDYLFKILKPHDDAISIKIIWVRPVDDSYENVKKLLLNRIDSEYGGGCNTVKEYFDVKRTFVPPPIFHLIIDSWFRYSIDECANNTLNYINNTK